LLKRVPQRQQVVDVHRITKALAARRARFTEINLLESVQTVKSAENDVQMTPGRHFELLPKLRIYFVAGQLHTGNSFASATTR
jgi:hypothetical protein